MYRVPFCAGLIDCRLLMQREGNARSDHFKYIYSQFDVVRIRCVVLTLLKVSAGKDSRRPRAGDQESTPALTNMYLPSPLDPQPDVYII